MSPFLTSPRRIIDPKKLGVFAQSVRTAALPLESSASHDSRFPSHKSYRDNESQPDAPGEGVTLEAGGSILIGPPSPLKKSLKGAPLTQLKSCGAFGAQQVLLVGVPRIANHHRSQHIKPSQRLTLHLAQFSGPAQERHNHPPLGKNQLNLLKNPHPLLSPVQQGARGLRLAEVMKPLLPRFSHFLDFGALGLLLLARRLGTQFQKISRRRLN